MIYAGIGSRETPKDILGVFQFMGAVYAREQDILRSGHARGADMAFETGCDEFGGHKEIFYAEDATPEAIKLASEHHPNWRACGPYARKLHGRNMMIILGRSLNEPVDMVFCWTPNGAKVGGTATGIRVAEAHSIPVVNFGNLDERSIDALS
jgi:hypothetical protein